MLAIGLMWLFADDFGSVFRDAMIPAFAALALILFVVHGRLTGKICVGGKT